MTSACEGKIIKISNDEDCNDATAVLHDVIIYINSTEHKIKSCLLEFITILLKIVG